MNGKNLVKVSNFRKNLSEMLSGQYSMLLPLVHLSAKVKNKRNRRQLTRQSKKESRKKKKKRRKENRRKRKTKRRERPRNEAANKKRTKSVSVRQKKIKRALGSCGQKFRRKIKMN